jgi:hypothetical protein
VTTTEVGHVVDGAQTATMVKQQWCCPEYLKLHSPSDGLIKWLLGPQSLINLSSLCTLEVYHTPYLMEELIKSVSSTLKDLIISPFGAISLFFSLSCSYVNDFTYDIDFDTPSSLGEDMTVSHTSLRTPNDSMRTLWGLYEDSVRIGTDCIGTSWGFSSQICVRTELGVLMKQGLHKDNMRTVQGQILTDWIRIVLVPSQVPILSQWDPNTVLTTSSHSPYRVLTDSAQCTDRVPTESQSPQSSQSPYQILVESQRSPKWPILVTSQSGPHRGPVKSL